jgi:hypothetical protein
MNQTLKTIKCPNGVTHLVSDNEDDFIEVIVEDEWVDSFPEQKLEFSFEEWEVKEFAEDEEHAVYLRGMKRFYLPSLLSIVDNSKPMDVSEVAKCFKIKNFFLTKGWVRFTDGVSEESSFDYD